MAKERSTTIRWDSTSCPERFREDFRRRVRAAWAWVRALPQEGHPRDNGYRPIPPGYDQRTLDNLAWRTPVRAVASTSLDLIGSLPDHVQDMVLEFAKDQGFKGLVPTLRKLFGQTRRLLGPFYITGVREPCPRWTASLRLDDMNLAALREMSLGIGEDSPEPGAP